MGKKTNYPVPDKEHPPWTLYVKMHPVGQCPAGRAYGGDCDGIGHWGPDPYAEELEGDDRSYWMCQGVWASRADDI